MKLCDDRAGLFAHVASDCGGNTGHSTVKSNSRSRRHGVCWYRSQERGVPGMLCGRYGVAPVVGVKASCRPGQGLSSPAAQPGTAPEHMAQSPTEPLCFISLRPCTLQYTFITASDQNSFESKARSAQTSLAYFCDLLVSVEAMARDMRVV